MTQSTRIDLTVPYAHKEEAKALGARWDGDRRTWYAPPGTDLRHFDHRWLPKGYGIDPESGPTQPPLGHDADTEKGVSLTTLLAQVKAVIDQGMSEAVWVRAEISELRSKNSNVYLTLKQARSVD